MFGNRIYLYLMIFLGFIAVGACNSAPDTSRIKRKWLDVEYAKTSSAQKLNIYLPDEGEGPFPVIAFFHGGAFKFGDKADGQMTPALDGVNRGYAVVSLNYRMSGEAKFPAYITDAKAAIRFLKANAGKYKLDPGKIAVWGDSAGGNIASLAATSCRVPELEDLSLGNETQNSCVRAAVDWFGPIDFLQMDEQFKKSGKGSANHSEANSPESLIMGGKLTDVPELVKKANPATYISAETPPFFIQHGTADDNVPTEQSINFAADLEKAGGREKVTLELLEGAGHGTSQFNEKSNIDKVFKFLDKYLK